MVDIRELRAPIPQGPEAGTQNAQLEKDKSDAELNLLAQTTHSFSPVAANLSANLNAAAPMDVQQINTLLSNTETRF